MAEGRMLKRRITLSKKMAALKTDKARLLWFYMLPFTDVDGRVDADPEDLKDGVLRKQGRGYSLARIQECLEDLNRVGLIILYQVNGRQYLEFSRHKIEQTLRRDKEAKSRIPVPLREQDGTTPAITKSESESEVNVKFKLNENETSARARFLEPSLRFADRMTKCFPHQSKSDKTAIGNLVTWLISHIVSGDLSETAFDCVIQIAEECKSGRKPIAVFFGDKGRLRQEIGYNAKAEKEKQR